MNDDRRYNAGRPYYRPARKPTRGAEMDYLATMGVTFAIGAMLGAVIVIGAITSGMVSL